MFAFYEVILVLFVVCYLLVKFVTQRKLPAASVSVEEVFEDPPKKKKGKKVSFCEYDQELYAEVEYDRRQELEEEWPLEVNTAGRCCLLQT